MTSICSSPPNPLNYAQLSHSPALTSPKSRANLRNSLTSPPLRPPQSPDAYLIPPLYLPRGHDSSDVAAFSKSLEENAAMSQHMSNLAKHSKQNTAPAPPGTQAGSADSMCDAEEGEPQGPFEGPEKLLELWFADSKSDISGHGLRSIDKEVWEEMLDIVKCKVLSTVSRQDADAYLLSESSMFIFPHKLILKTCGTTTLLLGLERIMQIANMAFGCPFPHSTPENLGRKLVKQCFYSRKSFMFPERQKGPHKDWMLEVGLLDRFFEGGSAYTVGKMNGDHWLLYMTPAMPTTALEPPAGSVERPLRLPSVGGQRSLSDQTLEILMTHLSPVSCARFHFPSETYTSEAEDHAVVSSCSTNDRGHLLGARLSDQLGLSSLFSGTVVDAFAFEPCGFSANALISATEGVDKTKEDCYWTVHVTPEQDSSYASFETNVHMDETGAAGQKDLPWLITRVQSIFEPGRLSVTLFTSSDRRAEDGEEDDIEMDMIHPDIPRQDQCEVLRSLQLKGYKRTDRIAYEFEDYDLVFVSFDKQDITLPRR